MNESIARLCAMPARKSRLILGLMSGTSLDGLDLALCRLEGSGKNTHLELLQFNTEPYPESLKDDIRKIFAKKNVNLEELTLLNALLADIHATIVLSQLKKWRIAATEVDCIASHGQTIYHAPQRLHGRTNYPNATLQIGDGDHLAVKTGIITLSDFRQKHVAAGGEGAPLALYGDVILFSSPVENRVLLNIGGISNFTYLPKNQRISEIICTDAGPGNTIIDGLMKKYYQLPFDKDGEIARSGIVQQELLERMLAHSFFKEAFPKTTGPELFNLDFLQHNLEGSELRPQDLLATSTEFSARAVALAIHQLIGNDGVSIYVSGGGCHNRFLMERLGHLLPFCKIENANALGLDPDAKEAALFAVLANETICGSVVETGAGPATTMGKISLPG